MAEGGASELLKANEEVFGDFEDLETGQKFSAEDKGKYSRVRGGNYLRQDYFSFSFGIFMH